MRIADAVGTLACTKVTLISQSTEQGSKLPCKGEEEGSCSRKHGHEFPKVPTQLQAASQHKNDYNAALSQGSKDAVELP